MFMSSVFRFLPLFAARMPARRPLTPRRPLPTLTPVLALALGSFFLFSAAPVRAQPLAETLGQISDDAHAAIIVPDLARTSERLARLKDRYGLPLAPLDDLLTNFKLEAGLAGIDDHGTMLIVLNNLDPFLAGESDTNPAVAALLPVSDYAAFVRGYGGNPDETVTPLTLPQHTGYARRLGTHALLSRTQKTVADYTPNGNGNQIHYELGTAGQRYLARSDVSLYLNVKAMRPALAAALNTAEAAVQDQFQAADTGAGPHQEQTTFSNLLITGLRSGLEDTTSLLLALELDEHGIALTQTLRYQPGSALASLFPGGWTQAAPLLARLPDQPFVFAMAADTQAFALPTLLRRTLSTIRSDAAPSLRTMIRNVLPLVEPLHGMANVQYVPTQQTMMSGNPFPSVSIYATDDVEQFQSRVKTYLRSLNGLSPLPLRGRGLAAVTSTNEGQAGTISTTYEEAALRVDGVEVDQYTYQAPHGDDNASAGPSRQTIGYLAATDGHLIMTTRPDLQLVRQAMQTIAQGNGIGSGEAPQQNESQDRADRRNRRPNNPRDRNGARNSVPSWLREQENRPATRGTARGDRNRQQQFRPWINPQPTADGPSTILELRPVALPADAMLEGYLSVVGLVESAKLMLPIFDSEVLDVPTDLPPVVMGVSIEGASVAGRLYVPHRTMQSGILLGQRIAAMLTAPPPQANEQQQLIDQRQARNRQQTPIAPSWLDGRGGGNNRQRSTDRRRSSSSRLPGYMR